MSPQRMETSPPPPILTTPSTTTTTKSWCRNKHHNTRDMSLSSISSTQKQHQQWKNNDNPCIIEDGYYMFQDDHSIIPATTTNPAKVAVLSIAETDYNEEEASSTHILCTFFYWYSTQMDTYPVFTKSITGGCSSILGDVIAQIVETTPYTPFNYRRIVAMFCTGLCFGPILHYTYEFYEYVLPINIDSVCADTVVTPVMRKCGGGEGFPSSEQTMSTNDMLLLADGTMIMKHDNKQLVSSNTTTNHHHHENNRRVERNNNDNDGNNDFIILSSNTFVEEYVDSTTETTTTHYQETSDCCHSTMFH